MTQQSLFDCNIVTYFVSKESRLPFSDEKRGRNYLNYLWILRLKSFYRNEISCMDSKPAAQQQHLNTKSRKSESK